MALAGKVDPISALDESKETWNIVTKVERLWVSPSLYGSKLPFSTDMVLMDSNGDKIHASVSKTLIYRFQHLITEGRVYRISFFGVGESGRDFRTTRHPYKINFQIHTSVRVLTNTQINLSPYSFMPISEIMLNDPDASFLIDVIGILTGANGEQEFEKDGVKQKKIITLELEQDGVRMECAFFGEILAQLSYGDMTNAVVVVHYAKIKPFRDIDETTKIRESFFERNDPASQVLSQLQDSGRISVEEDLLRQTDGKTIQQIKDLAQKTYCVVLGTVKYIPDGMDWYYPACKCSKKVFPADGMYFCEACNRHVVSPLYKFRIQLRVMDSNDSATFVLFDQEASALLNKSCADLVDASNKAGPDASNVPSEILELIDRTFLFKIEVANSSNSIYEPSYRVKKISSDVDLITQFDGSEPFEFLATPTSDVKQEAVNPNISKDLNADFAVAVEEPLTETPTGKVVDLSYDSQDLTPSAGSSTDSGQKMKSVGENVVTVAVSPGPGGSVESSNSGKMKLKVKLENMNKARNEKLKTLHAVIVAAVVTPTVSAENAIADVDSSAEASPPSKRPSPPDVDVKSHSAKNKKIFKAVKKEKI
ncbi:replication protein A 70 kDa DNA-binding subunit A-like [Lotus japonicus]|uniref:replication protein A 70 kDa DNA-binding subunit A-like n=1 Tax=Lotus japonicus TaxID=34305 RepID=UPI002590E84B|nr:replication protein A 70 kDa DNA-binding subunit A-like [Lotus japonicus]